MLDDAAATDAHDVDRESWMHVEIDRIPQDETEDVRQTLLKVLLDVREAVEDWRRMHAAVEAIVADLETDPPPLPYDEIAEGREFLTWLADDHFTFLGFREYDLVKDGDDELCAPCPAPGSASCGPTRCSRAVVRQAAPAGAAQGAREAPPGAGQGQLAGNRAPSRAPRLHRREEVRRRR